MCLAAKHLLWFPVSFCPFTLLTCCIFFPALLRHPGPHMKADWRSASEQGLPLVHLALLWFVLLGPLVDQSVVGSCSLPPAALLGLGSQKFRFSCCLFVALFSSHVHLGGELKEGQWRAWGSATVWAGNCVPPLNRMPPCPCLCPACHAHQWGIGGEPYAKGQLVPIWTVSLIVHCQRLVRCVIMQHHLE